MALDGGAGDVGGGGVSGEAAAGLGRGVGSASVAADGAGEVEAASVMRLGAVAIQNESNRRLRRSGSAGELGEARPLSSTTAGTCSWGAVAVAVAVAGETGRGAGEPVRRVGASVGEAERAAGMGAG